MKNIRTWFLATFVFACVIGLGVFIGLLGLRDPSVSPPVTHNQVTLQTPAVQPVHAVKSSTVTIAHTNRVQVPYHMNPVLVPKN